MALVVTSDRSTYGVSVHTYDNLDTADTAPASIELGRQNATDNYGAVHGFIQAEGTFGSGTVKLQGSNDKSNWVALKDSYGTAIGITADGGAEFFTGARYIRPLITGGSGDDVNVTISVHM